MVEKMDDKKLQLGPQKDPCVINAANMRSVGELPFTTGLAQAMSMLASVIMKTHEEDPGPIEVEPELIEGGPKRIEGEVKEDDGMIIDAEFEDE